MPRRTLMIAFLACPPLPFNIAQIELFQQTSFKCDPRERLYCCWNGNLFHSIEAGRVEFPSWTWRFSYQVMHITLKRPENRDGNIFGSFATMNCSFALRCACAWPELLSSLLGDKTRLFATRLVSLKRLGFFHERKIFLDASAEITLSLGDHSTIHWFKKTFMESLGKFVELVFADKTVENYATLWVVFNHSTALRFRWTLHAPFILPILELFTTLKLSIKFPLSLIINSELISDLHNY